VTCNCRPSTGEWQVSYCDPPLPDAGPPDCSACNGDEVCVVDFDGTCGRLGTRCVQTTCAACSSECDALLCSHGLGDAGPGFTCLAPACEALPSGAVGCYGP
jgi:hypothetical protein